LQALVRVPCGGVAAELERSRAPGTAATRNLSCVGLHEADLRERDTEPRGHDHPEGGGVSLSVRRGADLDGRRPVRRYVDLTVLAASTSHLDVAGDPDAQEAAIAPLTPRCLLGAQLLIARDGDRPVERALIITAVVGGPRERGQRKLGRLEIVTTADLDRVDVQLVCRDI